MQVTGKVFLEHITYTATAREWSTYSFRDLSLMALESSRFGISDNITFEIVGAWDLKDIDKARAELKQYLNRLDRLGTDMFYVEEYALHKYGSAYDDGDHDYEF